MIVMHACCAAYCIDLTNEPLAQMPGQYLEFKS